MTMQEQITHSTIASGAAIDDATELRFARHLNGQVLIRAVVVAALIGSVLTLVNQADAMTGSDQIEWLPLVLVFITPFLVVSASQVFGIREARKSAGRTGHQRESFINTLLSHGIPGRALVLSLAVGSTNTAIVAASALLAGRGLDELPAALIVQAVTLPAIFGALSQTLAYRRTAKASVGSAARI